MGMKKHSINMIHLFIISAMIGDWCPVNAELFKIDTLKQFATDSYDTVNIISDKYSESTPSTADILDEMEDIVAGIDEWGTGLKNKIEAMNTLVVGLPSMEAIQQDVHNLTEFIEWIDELYLEFRGYVEDPDSLTEDTAEELAKLYTSQAAEELISTMRDIFSLISPDEWGNYKTSLLYIVARKSQKNAIELCDVRSPQQRLLDFYSVIIITEMRALTMTEFGYLVKSFKGNESYAGDMMKIKKEFMQRVDKYVLILEYVMEVATGQFRRCDPAEGNKRGESFYEFERFMQAIVLDEMRLTKDQDCSNTCDTLPDPTWIYECDGIGCNNGVHKCQGFLTQCSTLNWAADICENDEDAPRRYKWIADGWGAYHPDYTRECNGKYNWPRSHKWLWYECDICRCTCVEDSWKSPSSHFISLREQLSDVADNMVIVGLKFRLTDKILHIDIRQGPLGNNGKIYENKVRWKAAEDIQFDRAASMQTGKFKFYKNNEDDEREEMIENKDVAALTWNAMRIYLDTLTAPSKHVITGIRFVRDLDETSLPINLEIQATPFDFESGKLDPENSLWIGPKDTSYWSDVEERLGYKFTGFLNPEESKSTVIDTKPNMFIQFSWSNFNADASQTVIPFVDGLTVYSDPPVGLGGVGLYHKSEPGYGGFFTFVLEGLDMTPFVQHSRFER